MTALDRLLDLLPPPYTAAPDSVLAALLDLFALEIEVVQEDLDRVRRTHWIGQAYRFEDARKIGALCGIAPLPWETLETYRARLLPLIEARLAGALGPAEIREFVHDYLCAAERALESTFVQGLATVGGPVEAYRDPPKKPLFRPLVLREFPLRERRSKGLADRGGLVPVLFRWSETNRGLEDCVPSFRITGVGGRRTAIPLLANLGTGDMILFADRLLAGAELEIVPDPGGDGRDARATLDGADVTDKLRSVSGFTLGIPFSAAEYDSTPRLPPLPRGENHWMFLSVGLYDARGLDRFFFALAEADLREGVFDQTRFDHALFPSDALARIEMSWTEREPASFEVDVPRTIVEEPAGAPAEARPHKLVAAALESAIGSLHAAGVRAAVRFVPFVETQTQRVWHRLQWIGLDSERGSAGANETLELGFHFEETGLGRGRFE